MLLEATKVVVDCLPRWKIVRQLPPRAAGAQHILNRVDDLVHVNTAMPPARFGRWNPPSNELPLSLRQIAGIGNPCHNPTYRRKIGFSNTLLEFARVRFEPYAPVRRQLLNILRAVNRARHEAGFEAVPASVLRLRRRIVKPFGQEHLSQAA